MGLAKEIVDLIRSNPEAKKRFDQAALDTLAGARGVLQRLFGRPPTVAERLAAQRVLVDSVADDAFPKTFKDTLQYLGVLLGTIVESTRLIGRGCILKSLYSGSYSLYFPTTSEPPRLMLGTGKLTQNNQCVLRYADGSAYEFFAFRARDDADLASLNTVLDAHARAPKAKEQAMVLAELGRMTIEPSKLLGIAEARDDPGSYHFVPGEVPPLAITLDFNDAAAVRRQLRSELTAVLAFERL